MDAKQIIFGVRSITMQQLDELDALMVIAFDDTNQADALAALQVLPTNNPFQSATCVNYAAQ